MKGAYTTDNEEKRCIWVDTQAFNAREAREYASLCDRSFFARPDEIDQETSWPACPDCLRIAAQIAEDKKELEK